MLCLYLFSYLLHRSYIALAMLESNLQPPNLEHLMCIEHLNLHQSLYSSIYRYSMCIPLKRNYSNTPRLVYLGREIYHPKVGKSSDLVYLGTKKPSH